MAFQRGLLNPNTGNRSVQQQLLHNFKWEPGKAEIQIEGQLEQFIPRNAAKKESMAKYVAAQIATLSTPYANLSPEQKKAQSDAYEKIMGQRWDSLDDLINWYNRRRKCMLSAWCFLESQMKLEDADAEVDAAFIKGFWKWLMGAGTDEEIARTPWGRTPPYWDEEVKAYIMNIFNTYFDHRDAIYKLVVNAQYHTLKGIDQFALFYKYGVHGNYDKPPDDFLDEAMDGFLDAKQMREKALKLYGDEDPQNAANNMYLADKDTQYDGENVEKAGHRYVAPFLLASKFTEVWMFDNIEVDFDKKYKFCWEFGNKKYVIKRKDSKIEELAEDEEKSREEEEEIILERKRPQYYVVTKKEPEVGKEVEEVKSTITNVPPPNNAAAGLPETSVAGPESAKPPVGLKDLNLEESISEDSRYDVDYNLNPPTPVKGPNNNNLPLASTPEKSFEPVSPPFTPIKNGAGVSVEPVSEIMNASTQILAPGGEEKKVEESVIDDSFYINPTQNVDRFAPLAGTQPYATPQPEKPAEESIEGLPDLSQVEFASPEKPSANTSIIGWAEQLRAPLSQEAENLRNHLLVQLKSTVSSIANLSGEVIAWNENLNLEFVKAMMRKDLKPSERKNLINDIRVQFSQKAGQIYATFASLSTQLSGILREVKVPDNQTTLGKLHGHNTIRITEENPGISNMNMVSKWADVNVLWDETLEELGQTNQLQVGGVPNATLFEFATTNPRKAIILTKIIGEFLRDNLDAYQGNYSPAEVGVLKNILASHKKLFQDAEGHEIPDDYILENTGELAISLWQKRSKTLLANWAQKLKDEKNFSLIHLADLAQRGSLNYSFGALMVNENFRLENEDVLGAYVRGFAGMYLTYFSLAVMKEYMAELVKEEWLHYK